MAIHPALAQPAPVPCLAQTGPGAVSKMCVHIEIQDGRLIARKEQSAFWFSPAFSTRVSQRIALDRIESSLRDQLEGILKKLPKPYVAALAPGETDQSLTDPFTTAVRTFSGSIQDYAGVMQTWSDANSARGQPADVLTDGSNFYAPLVASSLTTALAFSQEKSTLDSGLAILNIADPFDPATVELLLPASTGTPHDDRIRALRKALAPLAGTLWDQRAIHARLELYYQPLELAAEIVPGPSGTNQITINEGVRIAHIVLGAPDVTAADRDKVLWIVLSQREFNRIIQHPPPIGTADLVLGYAADLGYPPGAEPFEMLPRLQDRQLMLAELGFAVSVQPGTIPGTTTQQYHDLRIAKAASDAPLTGTTPQPTPPSSDARGAVNTAASPPGSPSSHPTPANRQEQQDKPWFVGGGLTYKPGQALAVLGLLNRSRLAFPLQNSSLSVEGSYPYGTVGSVNYFADYIGFNRFHQRLSLRLTGSTEVELRRYLLNRKLDEHRTGGLGQVIWEPFHDLDGGLFQIVNEFRRSTVTLQSNSSVAQKLNLTTFRTTGLYQFNSDPSARAHSLRIEPFVETGFGLSSTEEPFAVAGIDANYHQRLNTLAADFTGHFRNATGSTPIVELPSFGGSDVLRGFRTDDAIGRRYATLQSELWLPLPAVSRARAAPGQLSSILSKLRLAPFADVGGAWQTVDSKPGVRAGAGMGLRLDMNAGLNHVVLRLDWAYGFGDAATGGSRGKFYFSLVSNLPF